jgi:GTPase SAR1 family protein
LQLPQDNSIDDHISYDIYVLGSHGSGKTSLINQFMTSEHRNPFTNDEGNTNMSNQQCKILYPDGCRESSVSICVDGCVTDFMFFEGGSDEVSARPGYATR